jgi:hypothetical protein
VADAALDGTEDRPQALARGDRVRTAPGVPTLAELAHVTGAVTRLDQDSEAVVDRAESDGETRAVVRLGPGRSWHRTGPELYEADWGTARATARDAAFVVTVDGAGAATVMVVEGTAVVQGAASGSTVVFEGQAADVSTAGQVGPALPHLPHADLAQWIAVNRAVEHGTAPAHDPAPDSGPGPAPDDQVEPAPYAPARPLPPWVRWAGGATVAAAFAGVLVATYVNAQRAERVASRPPLSSPTTEAVPGPLPNGGYAMMRAAQDRHVAPEPPASATTPPPSTTPAPTTVVAPAAPAAARTTPTACTQRGSTVTLSGTLTNTGGTPSAFSVMALFTNGRGQRFATASTRVGPVAPGRTASWSVSVTAPGDLRGSGATCNVGEVRPV